MIALALLLVCLPEPAKASVIDVSGDVEVSLSFDGTPASPPSGVLELTQDGKTLVVRAQRAANASIAMGAPALEKLMVRDGARVTLTGFRGKSLHIVASGGAIVVAVGKNTRSLRIEGSGTSRIEADGLPVEDATVTLKDAARARVKAAKSLTCDLQRSSRLVVLGKPGKVDKKVAGVAKLELK